MQGCAPHLMRRGRMDGEANRLRPHRIHVGDSVLLLGLDAAWLITSSQYVLSYNAWKKEERERKFHEGGLIAMQVSIGGFPPERSLERRRSRFLGWSFSELMALGAPGGRWKGNRIARRETWKWALPCLVQVSTAGDAFLGFTCSRCCRLSVEEVHEVEAVLYSYSIQIGSGQEPTSNDWTGF